MGMISVDAKTVKEWLDKNEALIIDVREPGEYQAANIPGSKLIPLGSINRKQLPEAQGKKIVIHCQLGKRGGKACELLVNEDPTLDIYNLEGGISAWAEQGYPVNRQSSHFLPLDQQVQLTIGSGVLLGIFLSLLGSSWWLLLSAFFGAGLCFAGLTGNCYLAQLLAKMPWNK